ncbi:DUF3368 domain-containing protein [Baaleninema sp.]|uniref:DUF3368 domain-containing protein n=1 Tax=Baaleninema sp. TaxID=3101197 RepID=UPI003D084286
MPNVITNTSAIQYLYQTQLLDLLPTLYDRVTIPQAVADELSEGRKLGVSLPNISDLPWVNFATPHNLSVLPEFPSLGLGEREVIALAMETPDALVVLDDNLARKVAKQIGIQLTGTLGILLKAKQMGDLQTVRPVVDRLEELGFRVSTSMRSRILNFPGEQ